MRLKALHACYKPGQKSWDIKAVTHKKDSFPPSPPPDAMLMSRIQVIFVRFNIAWGRGNKSNGLLKQQQSLFHEVHLPS